jgi:hypothetical protein
MPPAREAFYIYFSLFLFLRNHNQMPPVGDFPEIKTKAEKSGEERNQRYCEII